MSDSNKLETYFAKQIKWDEGLQKLRKALLDLEFKEEVKWGMPTYTIDGKNLIGLAGFKNHFGVWFHQGVYLSDPSNLLVNAQEGKTRGMRHIKYFDSDEVDLNVLKPYFLETIKNHNEGKEIKSTKRKNNLEMPAIMESALGAEGLEEFSKMSLSKRNDYIEYIVTAKREATKYSRLEKIIPMILRGEGLNDQYK